MKKHIEIIEQMMFNMATHEIDGVSIFPTLIEAKRALEKQTPKKPTISKHKYIDGESGKEGEYHLTHCPICLSDKRVKYFDSLVDKGTKYCRRCGQALDWDEE